MIWNEPNNKSHWDPEVDPDWSIFGDTVNRAGAAIAALNRLCPSPIDRTDRTWIWRVPSSAAVKWRKRYLVLL